MGIGGDKREQQEFAKKKVGLFEGKVVLINPTIEQYKDVMNVELKEDSKACEYLGESNDGNTYLRVDVWLKTIRTEEFFRVSFFLENKERENKDMTKKQYINSVGICTWVDDPNNLPDWFKGDDDVERSYRVAFVGEEELYGFMRSWLSELDYRSAKTTLDLDWKKLMKGNVKDLRDQINGEWSTSLVALATVVVKERDGDVKEYQGVYNKAFLPKYALRNFRLMDYTKAETLAALTAKKPRDLKLHEKFVLNATGDYGCKDFFVLKELKEYDPDENMAASEEVLTEGGDDY